VFFGAFVTLQDDRGVRRRYRIVGPDEFDMEPEYISMDSPIARALLGRRLDEAIEVGLESGPTRLCIVAIEYRPG
jgi:transcription elongation factor GreB